MQERMEEKEREERIGKREGQDIVRENLESELGRYKLLDGMTA